jgi:pilus assembly protein Flp/PilA
MRNLIAKLRTKWKDEDGGVALEYVIIAGLIAIVIIGGAGLLGNAINDWLSNVANYVGTIESPPAGGGGGS